MALRDPLIINEAPSAAQERTLTRESKRIPKGTLELDNDSPADIQAAFRQLHSAIADLGRLPEPIRSKLDFEKLGNFNFEKIDQELDKAIRDEAYWRKIKVPLVATLGCAGGALGFRALFAALCGLGSLINPVPYISSCEMVKCGWAIAKWPSSIVGFFSGCIAGTGFACIKGENETKLIVLQQRIDEAYRVVSEFQNVFESDPQEIVTSEGPGRSGFRTGVF